MAFGRCRLLTGQRHFAERFSPPRAARLRPPLAARFRPHFAARFRPPRCSKIPTPTLLQGSDPHVAARFRPPHSAIFRPPRACTWVNRFLQLEARPTRNALLFPHPPPAAGGGKGGERVGPGVFGTRRCEVSSKRNSPDRLVHPTQECAGLRPGIFRGISPVSNGTYLCFVSRLYWSRLEKRSQALRTTQPDTTMLRTVPDPGSGAPMARQAPGGFCRQGVFS